MAGSEQKSGLAERLKGKLQARKDRTAERARIKAELPPSPSAVTPESAQDRSGRAAVLEAVRRGDAGSAREASRSRLVSVWGGTVRTRTYTQDLNRISTAGVPNAVVPSRIASSSRLWDGCCNDAGCRTRPTKRLAAGPGGATRREE